MSLFSANSSVGIHIDVNTICAVHRQSKGTGKFIWQYDLNTNENLFAGDVNILGRLLGEVLLEVAKRIKNKFIPINIALPDPLLHQAIFELDEIPRGERLRNELLKLRFQRDYQLDTKDKIVSYQILGRTNGKNRIFAMAVKQDVISEIERVFVKSKQKPSVIDAFSLYMSNHLATCMGLESSVVLCVAPHYWTIQIWDQQEQIRLIQSGWCDMRDRQPDDGLFKDVERVLRSYLHFNSEEKISNFNVLADVSQSAKIIDQLGRLFNCPIIDLFDKIPCLPGNNISSEAYHATLASMVSICR